MCNAASEPSLNEDVAVKLLNESVEHFEFCIDCDMCFIYDVVDALCYRV